MHDHNEFLRSLSTHLAAETAALDDTIRTSLYSDVALVQHIARYIIAAGGKRMRPALTLLSAQACRPGIPVPADTTTVAAIVELIHTATLLHDDVVDESTLRRGNATANAEFGNAASVLVGDFLYSRSFQMMVGTGRMRVMEVLSEATNVIAEGEVHQLMNAGNIALTEADYLHVIRAKTAKLFEAAARLGAIVVDASPTDEQALAQFGAHLGTAFQIADDVMDYDGDAGQIGKNLGDDLAEGKLTLPVIHALARATPSDRAALCAAIETPDAKHLPSVLAVLKTCGSIDYARRAAEDEAQLARVQISALSDTPAKQLLLNCTGYAVARTK
jgi:octaprenyl-diphosphate synthase